MTTFDEAQRMNIDELIRTAINGRANEVRSGKIADDVVAALWSIYEDGEPWAERWIRTYCREGIRRRVVTVVKRQIGSVLLSSSGTVLSVPTHVSRRVLRDGEPPLFQLKLWWELSWPEFVEMVANLTRQRRILRNEIRSFNEVTRLRDLYPESQTPGEACALAGINPAEFKLAEELTG